MPEDEKGIIIVMGKGLIQHRDPALYGGAGATVDKSPAAVEHQVSHMGDIGMLEMDNAVAIRMGGAEIGGPDTFGPYLIFPGIAIGDTGIQLFVFCFLGDGYLLLIGQGIGMRRHLLHQPFESDIAGSMVTVVMGIDQ